MSPPCLDEQRALDLVEGRLDPASRAAAHDHLAQCPACAALVADLAHVLDDGSGLVSSPSGSQRTPVATGQGGEDLDELAAPLPHGAIVGPYRVLHPLAAGGMGVVYVAEDPRLDRKLALKLLRADRVEPRAAERLRREARALAQLRSPHVVTVQAVGESSFGVWVAMELVEGQTLAEWLRQGTRPWSEVLTRFSAAARGLRDAHAAGLVHRDVKPSNVLLGDDGRVLVADFGLAAPLDAPVPEARHHDGDVTALTCITRSGGVVGTPAYMAPEQLAGRIADARSDQFSLCVALYEGLHGERPYVGNTLGALIEALERGRIRPRPAGSRVPRWLDRVIARGLDPDPAQRYADLDALLHALEPARHRRRIAALATIATVITLASLSTLTLASRPDDPSPCADVDPRVDAVWNDGQREALSAAFVATGAPEATRQIAAVTRALDVRAGAWRTAAAEACAATQSSHADPHLDQRLQCLQTALDETEAAVDSLVTADLGAVRRADTVLPSLTRIESCDDPAFLDAVLERPDDPSTAPAIAKLRHDVAAARTRLAATRDLETAIASFTTLLERASALHYAPLEVSTRNSLGRALDLRGDSAAAVKHLQPAFFGAQQLGDHDAAFTSAVQLVQAHGHGLGQLDEALQWSRHAEAAALTLGDPAERAVALLVRGELLYVHGRDAEAETTLLAAWEGLPPDALPRRRASVAETLGNLYASRWEAARALPFYDEALALQEARVGLDHYDLLRALNGRAVCLVQLERWDEAIVAFERAVAIAEANASYVAGAAAQLTTNLGALLEQRGDVEGALVRYQDAITQLEAQLGPAHDETLSAQYNVANALRKLGRHEQAIAAASLGIARGLDREPPAPEMPIKMLWVQAQSHRARGELDEARAALEHRVALRREHTPDELEGIAADEAELAELGPSP